MCQGIQMRLAPHELGACYHLFYISIAHRCTWTPWGQALAHAARYVCGIGCCCQHFSLVHLCASQCKGALARAQWVWKEGETCTGAATGAHKMCLLCSAPPCWAMRSYLCDIPEQCSRKSEVRGNPSFSQEQLHVFWGRAFFFSFLPQDRGLWNCIYSCTAFKILNKFSFTG